MIQLHQSQLDARSVACLGMPKAIIRDRRGNFGSQTKEEEEQEKAEYEKTVTGKGEEGSGKGDEGSR